jgi:hypothetical protein
MGVKGMEELGAGPVDNMLNGVVYDLCGALLDGFILTRIAQL